MTSFKAGLRPTPDRGIPIHDKDQLAPLIAGVATLSFTMYKAGQVIKVNGFPGINTRLEGIHPNNNG